MITDPLFYRLFETSPETFFLLLGMSTESAREMSERYQYQAIEFKETSHRVDGVFLPREIGLPIYFLEVQFYYLPSVFADLLVKVYTYLKQHKPGQPFCGVVLFADQSLEPSELAPYLPLLESGLIRRFYLDEMSEVANAPLGLSILFLIQQTVDHAPGKARELVARVKTEIGDDALRDDLIELIETVIIYKLPRLSREEIQSMLQIHDIRESRVYQEAKEEGLREERRNTIAKLVAKKMTAGEIAKLLDLDVEQVQQEMSNADPRS
ncbi:MAG TPA: Rpn family recombination-promoting nuclease/putative transposase [Gemmata sp.]|jgi:predicted transposase/invertase (TIGR01784 family)|nr:Rpn family recombination-promoting nuclease/putative transposase [Gemmata sp.]